MRTLIKVILTIVVFLIVAVLGGLLKEANGGTRFGPIYWIIILPTAFAVWKTIWKYNPDAKKENSSELQKKDDDDKYQLNKN